MNGRVRSVFISLTGVIAAAAVLASAVGLATTAVQAQHQPVGERFHIKAADLPAPFATPSAVNPPARVSVPADPPWQVPPGFHVNAFASGLSHARWMTVAANGDVFLAEPRAGHILLLRDADGDGRAEYSSVFVSGLERPHGLVLHDGHLYIGSPRTISRTRYSLGETRARTPPEPVTVPGALGAGGGHWTRNLVFSGDGANFFVTVGSRANVGEEAEVRASVQQFDAAGRGQQTFAGGLRNPVGIARYPGTDDLYVVVNERDGLGDGLAPDFFTRVVAGGFYGWPYAYAGPHPDPALGSKRPDLVAATRVPDVLFQAHSAPIGLVFYDADQFPSDYRGDAFVALRGSWNAEKPTGYKIVRVPFEKTRPQGYYETFASGFWVAGDDRARVWGRPAGLAIATDGSLLVADDTSQTVWRISYRRCNRGKRPGR